MAGKYLTILETQIKNLFEYRINVLLKLIRPLVMTFVYGSLWIVIFQVSGEDVIAGFTPLLFIMYLLVIRFVASMSPGHAAIEEINEEIIEGNIALRLVRPMNYLGWLFCRSSPLPIFSGMLGIVLVFILASVFSLPIASGLFLLLFLLSIPAAVFVLYAIYLFLGILSFWVYDVWPLEMMLRNINFVFSGEFIPLTLFGSAQTLFQYLPFASIAFIPGGLFVELFTLPEAATLVLVQYAWAIVLWGLVIFMFKKGLKKFEAQGG